jgi:hypothetical protein
LKNVKVDEREFFSCCCKRPVHDRKNRPVRHVYFVEGKFYVKAQLPANPQENREETISQAFAFNSKTRGRQAEIHSCGKSGVLA